MMCYEKCCRLCLKDLVGPGIDCTSITEIRDAISVLFDVKITRNDMTRCICNKCFENVMAFKAFKKTVAECQSIIQDYEIIKKKIMESRTISIKEEIIDISDTESPGAANKSKKKRPLANAVTDSQINDILDMVHDSPGNRNSLKSNLANKKLKTVTANSTSAVPVTIKKEPNTSSTPPPISTSENRATRSTPSTSGGSKNTTNKDTPSSSNSTPKNDTRSDSLCSTSTSGIGSSLDASKVVVKKEPGTGCEVSQSKDANTEAVSSSVQTPTEENQANGSETLPNSTSTPIPKKKGASMKAPNRTSSVGTNNNNSIEKESNAVTNQSSAENSTTATANGTSTKLYCDLCLIQFKLEKEYEIHMKKHKSIKEEHDKSQSAKNKQAKNIKEESAISSSEEEVRVPLTRGRSSRQAKTQALKKMGATPPKRRHSSSPAGVKKPRTAQKLNSTVDSTTPAEHSEPPHSKTNTPAQLDPPSAPAQIQQQKPPIPKDKKRVITITLLRTKESVNFKYCDQFKNIIDFDTITPEELQDIRISLMIPEIWSNLTNVFKTSPPDEKTVEQLKNIFGDKFRI